VLTDLRVATALCDERTEEAMRRTLLLAALAALALFIVAGCGDETTDGTTPAAPETTPATSPATSPTQPVGDAAALYADNCAGCHAADGSGGRGPDLRDEDNVQGIAEQIREGGDSMPAFAGELTDAQIDELAAYVAAEL
jgi:mono/diheme cytochrome c family protein